jgi:hypothetical protein
MASVNGGSVTAQSHTSPTSLKRKLGESDIHNQPQSELHSQTITNPNHAFILQQNEQEIRQTLLNIELKQIEMKIVSEKTGLVKVLMEGDVGFDKIQDMVKQLFP